MAASGVAEVEWNVEPSRSGEPTLKVGDRSVHSLYAPLREAHEQAQRIRAQILAERADFLVMVGLGLGYLPEALCKTWSGPILVWDPFPAMSRALPLRTGRWTQRVRFVHSFADLEGPLGEQLRLGRRPTVWTHPGYTDLCRFELRRLALALRARRGETPELAPESAVVSERSLSALARLPLRHTVSELEGVCRGQTAVVVCPGPSMQEALEPLARRKSGVVFAAIQALGPLQDAGVHVDFVVAPDPLEFAGFVKGFEPSFGALLAESAVQPEALDRWPDRTYLFQLRSDHLHQVAWERCGLPVLDEPLMTVAETAFLLAHRLGARRLVMAGVDLCGAANRYKKFQFRARDLRGEPVVTNVHYFHAARYLSELCPALAREGCEIWRLGHGLPIEGPLPADSKKLSALLDEAPAFVPPAPAPVEAPERRRVVADLLRWLAAGPEVAPQSRRTLEDPRWADFRELAPGPAQAAARQMLSELERRSAGALPSS